MVFGVTYLISRFKGKNMVQLSYVIEFVGDMERAVKFYRDVVGLPLKFQSPEWSEFSTGDTTLALHPASKRDAPSARRTSALASRQCGCVPSGL